MHAVRTGSVCGVKKIPNETVPHRKIRLLCGGNASARAAVIDRVMLDHWDRALLIVPTREQARRRAEHLILDRRLAGAWGGCVIEFNDFARRVIESEGVFPAALDNFERRLLLESRLASLLDQEEFAPFRAAAATPGFAAQMLHVITGLKQAAIEPGEFRARVASGNAARAMDGAVTLAYRSYQEALLASGLYDIPGLYWEADIRCRNALPRMLDGVEAICFDGFDDFTPSQIRLIESAAAHAAEAVIGINFDENPDRADLYALSGAAARALAVRFGCVAEYHPAPPPTRHSEFAARTLFWRNPPLLPDVTTRDLTVVPCATPAHEIETIARRVKTLLVNDGIAPDRIAVVFRRLGDIAATVRAVFGEMGVPVRVVEAPALAESALGAFLRRLIAAMEGWNREAILEVLTSPLVGGAAFPSASRGAFPMIARQAGVLAGFDDWTRKLEAFVHALREPVSRELKAFVQRYPAASRAADDLLRQVRLLHVHWDALPPDAPPRDFATKIEAFCDALGVAATIRELHDQYLADCECAALNALHGLLAIVGRARERNVPKEAFLNLFQDGLRETTYRIPAKPGAIGVYDASSIRNLEFDHVFFGGLNEGEVPLPGRMSAVYSESDLDDLRTLGIGLGGQGEHNLRERLLFHHVIEAARERLTLSWHVHSSGGKEADRSPFLKEILDLFGTEAGIEERPPFSDVFVAGLEDIASSRDLRNCAFFHVPALRDAYSDQFEEIEAGVAIERARHDTSPFGSHDGVLADRETISRIMGDYGPDHCFSVSKLETYIECPFRFFQEQILKVAEAVEPSDEMHPMLRGLLLHDAMRRFHQRHRGKCFAEIDEADALVSAREAVSEAFDTLLPHESSLLPGAVQIERGRMIATVTRYVRIERDSEKVAWRPVIFETAFGGAPEADSECASKIGPFELETSEGPVRFSGRIDRIDEDGDHLRVVDYKSSEPPAPKEVKEGRSIQLGVYALAAEALICPDKTCVEAVFLQPGRKKKTEALDRAGRDGGREERTRILIKAIGDAVRGIRQGRFPPSAAGDACRTCGHEKACRFERARIERKTGAATE